MTLLEKSEMKDSRQKAELKTENSMLEGRLSDERGDRERLIELLEEAVTTKNDTLTLKAPTKRGRRLLVTGVVAGTAYLLGARAGRARYTQVLTWVKKASSRIRPAAEDIKEGTLAAVAAVTEPDSASKSKEESKSKSKAS